MISHLQFNIFIFFGWYNQKSFLVAVSSHSSSVSYLSDYTTISSMFCCFNFPVFYSTQTISEWNAQKTLFYVVNTELGKFLTLFAWKKTRRNRFLQSIYCWFQKSLFSSVLPQLSPASIWKENCSWLIWRFFVSAALRKCLLKVLDPTNDTSDSFRNLLHFYFLQKGISTYSGRQ